MCHRLYSALLLLGTLLLTSCVPLATPPEPTPFAATQAQEECTEIIEEKLKAFPFLASTDAALIWIQDQYEIELSPIQGGPSADGSGDYRYWWVGQRRFDITLWVDARDSAVIRVRWDGKAPSLAIALRCLGAPPLYRAYLSPTPAGAWTYLELWYPERGIMVTAFVPRRVSGMTIDQAMASIAYVQPGSSEDLIARFFPSTTRDSDRYVERLKGLRPWPGDITKITIDERG